MSQVSRSCQETQLCALQSRRPGKTSHRLGNVSYASESTNHNVRGMTVQLDHSHSKHSWNVTSLSKSWVIRMESHIHRVMQCHAYMVTVHFGWIRCNFKMQCQSVLYIFCAKTSASRRSFSCEICIQFLQDLHGVISMNLQIQCELDLHSTCLRTVSRRLTAFCWHQWLFLWAHLELCHTFLKCHYFHSQTLRLPDFTLPDSLSLAWSCWAFCRPSSSACCFFASFSWWQDDNQTNNQATHPSFNNEVTLFKLLLFRYSDWIGGLAAVLLVAHHLFLHQKQSSIFNNHSLPCQTRSQHATGFPKSILSSSISIHLAYPTSIRPIPKFARFSRSLGLPRVDNLFE